MGKPKYDPPTPSFPYKIIRRLNLMSVPKKNYLNTGEGMPEFNPRGIRKSALRGHGSDRVNDVGLPRLRKLLQLKKMYKNQFTAERLERIDRVIEATNATIYSKLANCVIDLKGKDTKDTKKKRPWTETDWKKHMDYISQIAGPKKDFTSSPITRGPRKPLKDLLPRINRICHFPEFKEYRRPSKETWYRDPVKVSPNALKYTISDRVKKLAAHRVIPQYT